MEENLWRYFTVTETDNNDVVTKDELQTSVEEALDYYDNHLVQRHLLLKTLVLEETDKDGNVLEEIERFVRIIP